MSDKIQTVAHDELKRMVDELLEVLQRNRELVSSPSSADALKKELEDRIWKAYKLGVETFAAKIGLVVAKLPNGTSDN